MTPTLATSRRAARSTSSASVLLGRRRAVRLRAPAKPRIHTVDACHGVDPTPDRTRCRLPVGARRDYGRDRGPYTAERPQSVHSARISKQSKTQRRRPTKQNEARKAKVCNTEQHTRATPVCIFCKAVLLLPITAPGSITRLPGLALGVRESDYDSVRV